MTSKRSSAWLAMVAGALALSGCGGGAGPGASTAPTTITIPGATVSTTAATTTTTEPAAPGLDHGGPATPPADEPHGPAETAETDSRLTQAERAAAATAREYVAALDARDGDRLCALLAPGAIYELDLPLRRRGECRSLTVSIGYRDPRGLPVWEGAKVARIGSVAVANERAKVVATVVTRFADRSGVSVEDDVVYLVRRDGDWLVAKPSSTLYRAVGIADVPPSVLAPPN